MNKFLKYLGYLVIISIAVSIGLFVGAKVERYSIEEANGNLSNSTKIALVNLDEGVVYQGDQRNFANEILGNEVDKYTFTGLEDAKSGTGDGRYAAYIIIPSDFSNNIVSINNTPLKSLLKYEISGNLTDIASDEAWQNVMKLKEKLNDDVGYMYISSILSEFHEGQTNALKVLSNDSKDKEVIMAISNLDLVATLDLREVDRLQNNIEDLDINPDVEENKKIIEAIDVAYKSYLSDTSEQLSALKTDSNSVNADNAKLETAGNNIKNIENDDGSTNYSTSNINNFLTSYNTNVSSSLSTLLNDINNKLQNQDNDTLSYVSNKSAELDLLISDLQKNHDEIGEAQYLEIKSEIVKIINSYIDAKVFDWLDFTKLSIVLENQEVQEKVDNAVKYLDKSILKSISEIDFTLPDLDFDEIVTQLDANTVTDTKLKQSLIAYAISIGKSELDANVYTIKDYLSDNDDILLDFPEIDSTNKTDLLKEAAKVSLEEDSKHFLTNATDEIKTTFNNYIDNIDTSDIKEKSSSMISDYKNNLKNVPASNLNSLIAIANGIAQIESAGVMEQMKNDLSPLVSEQKQNRIELLDVLQRHKLNNGIFNDRLSLYDPLQFINAREIENYVQDFENNNQSTKYKMESKNREYTTFVSESYKNANDHVNSMEEDIQKYQNLSDESIKTGLENAKSIKNETSVSNNGLLIDYINKLPYTKNGTVANTTIYDFITTPADMEGNKVSSKSQITGANIIFGTSVTTISIISLWIVVYLMNKRKQAEN